MTSGIVLLLLLCILLWGGQYPGAPEGIQIVSTFSGISLTLFGGGYVVIPALHELFVDNLNWLTSAEFADGIAIGQITPGPIFITATFIGYKVAGITGALLATLAMFTPPAVLTVLLSRFVKILQRTIAEWTNEREYTIGRERIDNQRMSSAIGVMTKAGEVFGRMWKKLGDKIF